MNLFLKKFTKNLIPDKIAGYLSEKKEKHKQTGCHQLSCFEIIETPQTLQSFGFEFSESRIQVSILWYKCNEFPCVPFFLSWIGKKKEDNGQLWDSKFSISLVFIRQVKLHLETDIHGKLAVRETISCSRY